MNEEWRNLIDTFKYHKVLVIGDAMLDTYVKGTTDRICREAPAPVITVMEQEFDCGGAANTAINVAALGAETYFLSVVGKDECGKELLKVLKKNQVNTECVIQDKKRSTIAKKRITVSSTILLRIDEGNTDQISEQTQRLLNQKIKKIYPTVDAVILSDYESGLFTDSLIQALEELRFQQPKPLIVDSKDLHKFKKLKPTAVKPNYEETIKLLKLPKLKTDRVQQVQENGKKLFEVTGAQYIAATLDADGTVLFEKGKKPYRILAVPHDDKKAIGAGDTFISALTLALCSNATAPAAAEIGAAAAAVVIEKEGTVVCTGNDLKAYFNDNPKYVVSLEDLARKVQSLKKEGHRIVFTNGCFDILHRGHVNLLNQAKALGDVLIVGINSDDSIRRLKGSERPINSLEDRIIVLAGLESVDFLVSFEEDSPVEIIKALKPDVFAKGGDYTVESLPEAPLVHKLGGQVRIIPFVSNRSTTNVIKKIREATVKNVSLNTVKDGYEFAKAGGLE
jgi:D-beta-D-heptose 7-phosphate kinase/D-beta-D-heptose 1-phosphate adenosyltransferase